jgi:hypothetical protein
MNPRKRKLRDRVRGVAWEVEEWWCRHVTQRELYRRLDNLLLVDREDRPDAADMLRLRADFLYAERGHKGGHDGQK